MMNGNAHESGTTTGELRLLGFLTHHFGPNLEGLFIIHQFPVLYLFLCKFAIQ